MTRLGYSKFFDIRKIGRRIRCDVGRKLSQIGERYKMPQLIYNPLIFAQFHWLAIRSAPCFVRLMRECFPGAQRLVDVGAGTGAYCAEFAKNGTQIVGIEYSAHARRKGIKQGVDMRPFDLALAEPAPITGMSFDLAYSLEVAEHLTPAMGDTMVEYMSKLAPTVVFTAAQPPPRGGIGHINEQPRQYWIQRFEAQGMRSREDIAAPMRERLAKECKDAWWLGENLSVFTR